LGKGSHVEDCYQILGIPSSASASEIKRAFRRKAKELHPDIPVGGQAVIDRQERMRDLIRAYKVLSDPERRVEFDNLYTIFRKYSPKQEDGGFDYRRWLSAREDPESRAKLIFFDLLHDLEDQAVLEYRKQRDNAPSFMLSGFFSREDFMDCGFILAEELFFREEYYESFLLLAEVIQLERSKPYFRHFFPEVMLLTRTLLRTHVCGIISDELALDCLETALELGFGKKEDAVFLKLMSMCYDRLGDMSMARLCLEKALALDSSLTGIKELRRRLAV